MKKWRAWIRITDEFELGDVLERPSNLTDEDWQQQIKDWGDGNASVHGGRWWAADVDEDDVYPF